jgi:hypothetical protein
VGGKPVTDEQVANSADEAAANNSVAQLRDALHPWREAP